MPYLYRTKIYTNKPFIRALALDETAEENNQSDFETNYKNQAVKIDDISVAENTFTIEKSYVDFKALIVGGVLWSDVKYFSDDIKYVLNLITNNPL